APRTACSAAPRRCRSYPNPRCRRNECSEFCVSYGFSLSQFSANVGYALRGIGLTLGSGPTCYLSNLGTSTLRQPASQPFGCKHRLLAQPGRAGFAQEFGVSGLMVVHGMWKGNEQ